ncbi:MAG: CRTAC1 family protein [Gammaproteobacteria bacterium]|nr:CRTAC1 family protein [Gammaproteobacteria bacterium]
MSNNHGAEETPAEHEVPEDDRVIASAFRYSILIFAAIAIVGLALAWWLNRAPEVVPLTERPLAGPESAMVEDESQPPPVRFSEQSRAAGITFVHVNGAYGEQLLPETMGSGVAVIDYDNDGRQDLLFVNAEAWPWRAADESAGPVASQALYRNAGGGRFEDVSAAAGLDKSFYGVGVATADYDGDGFTDIFITALGENRLFRNDGQGRFEERTSDAGVAGAADAWSTSAAFFDYDGDSDLDLFVTNYVLWSRDIDLEVDYQLTGIGRAYGPPANYAGTHNYLYRNEGNGQFTDVSAEAGIEVVNAATGQPAGKGLAVVPFDHDADGWTDIAVANDTVRNFLYRNLGDGRFEEIGAQAGLAFDNQGNATGAMGIDAAVINESEDLAVAIGNFANEMTSFYVARGGSGQFTDEAIVTGVGPDSRKSLSFGLFFFDFDLDGRLDMLQTNGHVEDDINVVQPSQQYAQPSQLFWNCGQNCQREFVKVPDSEAGDLATPVVGRGATYLDYDEDGDLDLVITQVERPPLLLRNEQDLGHHWLRVSLAGKPPNTNAIGARVELKAGGKRQIRVVNPSRSYLSQVELPVTFGLGELAGPVEITVNWPDGTLSTHTQAEIDRPIILRQP